MSKAKVIKWCNDNGYQLISWRICNCDIAVPYVTAEGTTIFCANCTETGDVRERSIVDDIKSECASPDNDEPTAKRVKKKFFVFHLILRPLIIGFFFNTQD